jgi:hypothetical protein
MSQPAHFPSFAFLKNRTREKPAYPKMTPPIKILTSMRFTPNSGL